MNRREFLKIGAGAAAAVAAAVSLNPLYATTNDNRPPNILFLFADQHNASVLGCTGHPEY